ncbi:MAG: hypothetical protein QW484_03330 [Candidatus Pacearchaeota archaeon]
MEKTGDKIVIGLLIIVLLSLIIFFLSPKLIIDGKATAPPPHTYPERSGHVCGNGNCESGENYYDCPEDCCGEEDMQVRTQNSCCEGLTAVIDVCEFEWPKEEKVELPVLPPTPPSTEAIKEFPPGTGAAIAPPQQIPEKYCWFCVNCGDGKCSKHETGENCAIDCAVCGNGICESPKETYENCPEDCCAQAGYRGKAPVKCCEGLRNIDPCDVPNPPQYCTITMKQEACINCGNGICEEYENVKNCPEDCLSVVANCEDLPKLEISALDRNDKIEFWWRADSIIPESRVYIKEADECISQECNFGQENLIINNYQPGTSPQEYFIDMPQDNLKFYKFISKVKIGPKEANCKPECMFIDSDSEGFYDPCFEAPKLLKYSSCANKEAHCCFKGTRSEGWYDVDCDKATEENLITYDSTCHLGAMLCEQESDLMVKYTQEFKKPEERGALTARTGVNWLHFVNFGGIVSSDQLLKIGGSPFDYVAYWDPEKQEQHGTAEGDPKMVCEQKPGQKQGVCYLERVFTGVFTMKRGHPYFVSLRVPQFDMTYVGKVPEHVTFEFKYGPSNSGHANYIVLPLDTTIKTAKDLCEAKADNGQDLMSDDDNIGFWDVEQQKIIMPAARCFYIKNVPGYNFNLEAGKIYLITVPGDRTWTQK